MIAVVCFDVCSDRPPHSSPQNGSCDRIGNRRPPLKKSAFSTLSISSFRQIPLTNVDRSKIRANCGRDYPPASCTVPGRQLSKTHHHAEQNTVKRAPLVLQRPLVTQPLSTAAVNVAKPFSTSSNLSDTRHLDFPNISKHITSLQSLIPLSRGGEG